MRSGGECGGAKVETFGFSGEYWRTLKPVAGKPALN